MLGATSVVNAASKNKSSLIVKAGTFKLANKSQTIGVPVTFDDSSSSVFAIEYEKMHKRDMTWGYEKMHKRYMTWGVELISYSNDYALGAGTADAIQVMVNIKSYYKISKSVWPYVGLGIGVAGVSLGGVGTGSGRSIGYQGIVGVKFPFKAVSAIVEYKYVSSHPEDSAGIKVDTSGSGIFAGIGINF